MAKRNHVNRADCTCNACVLFNELVADREVRGHILDSEPVAERSTHDAPPPPRDFNRNPVFILGDEHDATPAQQQAMLNAVELLLGRPLTPTPQPEPCPMATAFDHDQPPKPPTDDPRAEAIERHEELHRAVAALPKPKNRTAYITEELLNVFREAARIPLPGGLTMANPAHNPEDDGPRYDAAADAELHWEAAEQAASELLVHNAVDTARTPQEIVSSLQGALIDLYWEAQKRLMGVPEDQRHEALNLIHAVERCKEHAVNVLYNPLRHAYELPEVDTGSINPEDC